MEGLARYSAHAFLWQKEKMRKQIEMSYKKDRAFQDTAL
jgi:hypothetical protein